MIDPLALESHFDQLASLAPQERLAQLKLISRQSPDLARRLAALLDAHEATTTTMDGLVPSQLRHWTAFDPEQLIGQQLGDWLLTRELGRGGMGVVFAARREAEGVEQQAAIKFLSLPVFDAVLADRFVREAKMLTRLNHPGICRLRDWGRTDQGWPYLVLDLIDGQPIDEATSQWSRREKLATIAKVAETVAAAHRQMVIHLDLKPDNILIDAQRNAILLDFGVSRVLAEKDGEATATLTRWLTPNYASPEQLRGEPATAASDIFALGVITYQLLTGERPHDLTGLSITDALARLENPTWPQGGGRKRIQGDLRAVLARAMHPDASQRYASAQSLADDLQAVLARRPVAARPDSLAYRLKKLVQRNPIVAPLGALSAAAIVLLAAQLAWQANDLALQRDRADLEATRARAASELLLGAVQAADPTGSRASATTVGEMLEAAIDRAVLDAEADPLLAAETLLRIADVRRVLGEYAGSIPVYELALELIDPHPEPELELRSELLSGLAASLRQTEQSERARSLLVAELEQAPFPADWRVWLSLAQIDLAEGDLDSAEQALQRASERVPVSLAQGRAMIAHSTGNLHTARGQLDEGLSWFEQAIAAARSGPVSRETLAAALLNSADILSRQGRIDPALAAADEALSLRIEMFGSRHVRTIPSHISHAYVLMHAGRWDEALTAAYRAADLERSLAGPDTRRMAAIWSAIGLSAERSGDWERAAEGFSEALAIQQELLPDDHHDLAATRSNLASVLMAQDQFEQPLELLMQAWEVHHTAAQGQASRSLAITEVNIAWCYLHLGEPGEALRWSRSALQGAEQVIDPEFWLLGHFRNVHAEALMANGRIDEAKTQAQTVEHLYAASEIPVRLQSLTDNLELLKRIALQSGENELAEEYRQRLRKLASDPARATH
ncbi:MAG: tetratricopeptide repeat protein [Wenzhouxiangella sp.]|nr:tetratricopeptide repeat protein [Wenzhouxiangella sp.]